MDVLDKKRLNDDSRLFSFISLPNKFITVSHTTGRATKTWEYKKVEKRT